MPIENQHQLLDEIDARQNEVLDQLQQLNQQIEAAIEQIVGERAETSAGVPASSAPSADSEAARRAA